MRRRPRITSDQLVLAGLAVGLVVAFAAGFAAREVLGSVSSIRQLVPRISLEDLLADRSLDWPFALDGAVPADAFDGAIFADRGLTSALEAEDADPEAIARALASALEAEAVRQTALAAEVAASREELGSADGRSGTAADLLWIQEAHARLADDLAEAAAQPGSDEGASDPEDLLRLSQAASGVIGGPDAEMRRFAGSGSAGARRLTPEQAVTRLLLRETSLSLAKRDVRSVSPALERALYGELTSLMRRKASLGAEGWAQLRVQTVDRVVREFSETLTQRRADGLVLCALTVQDYELVSASTDMTLTVEGSTVMGFFGGTYAPAEGKGSAVVNGTFQGTVRNDRMIEATGEYELDERSGGKRLAEKGDITVAGLRTRTGEYLGSITLKPTEPLGPRRTILWRSIRQD